MKSSNIGGQAVLEGIMMRNGGKYSVAVRKTDGEIAVDIPKSGTRREDLLLNKDEQEAVYIMRRAMNGMKAEEAVDNLLNMFARTKTNAELVHQVIRQKFI